MWQQKASNVKDVSVFTSDRDVPFNRSCLYCHGISVVVILRTFGLCTFVLGSCALLYICVDHKHFVAVILCDGVGCESVREVTLFTTVITIPNNRVKFLLLLIASEYYSYVTISYSTPKALNTASSALL